MRSAFITACLLLLLGLALPVCAQQQEWVIEALSEEGSVTYSLNTGMAVGTNGVIVKYGNAVLVADSVSVNRTTGEVIADGRVRIQSEDMVWAGEHVIYNFMTRVMTAEQFRAGQAPMFVGGEGLSGDTTNNAYTATNGFITLDDYSNPLLKVRAKRLVIRPGDKLEAHGATLCIGSVPIFYLPYYSQSLDATAPAFTFRPGYSSSYGAYLLSSYEWNWGDIVGLKLHADYRSKRGFGGGPDLSLNLGKWGDALFRYYYLYDRDSETNYAGNPYPHTRQRIEFSWLASPYTNTTFKSRVSYETDAGVRREFFEGEYRKNVQPISFLEGRHFWDNFSLSAIASPQVNEYYETIERLPEIKFTGYRQQIAETPLYYQSESRAGYLRREFADTNSPSSNDYEATRADSFHQIVLPMTMFGWLNITPNVGGRLTHYSEADGPGATTEEQNRSIFSTGADASFKLSRTWANAQGGLFNLDGLRHIMVPSAGYVYVPDPDADTNDLPQFDFYLPSLTLLPNEFPEDNAIDALGSRNLMRLGLDNRLQTKRDGQIEDFLSWNTYTDWRIDPESGQDDFSDLWSDFKISPRSWLTLQSQTRLGLDDGQVELSYSSVTFKPGNIWSWRVGYYYLRDNYSDDPTAWGNGDNVLTSTTYLRLNENWALRAAHYFNADDGELEEQMYSVLRDFRSWTASLSFRAQQQDNGNTDYTIGVAFSIKALPRFSVGQDTVDTGSFFDN